MEQNKARDYLTCEIARFFYSVGLPFNTARNPYLVNMLTFAAKREGQHNETTSTYQRYLARVRSEHIERWIGRCTEKAIDKL